MWRNLQVFWQFTSAAAPPPVPVIPSGGLLHIDVPRIIFSEITTEGTESSAFALPSKATRLTWLTKINPDSASVIVLLKGSLNNTNYATIDTATAEGLRNVNGGFGSVQAVLSANPDGSAVTVIIEAKRKKI